MRLQNSGTWRHSAYVPYRKWRTRKHGSRAPRPTHIPVTVIWILRIQCIIPNHGYQSMIMTLSRQSLQSVRLKLLFFRGICTVKMEAVRSSEAEINLYRTERRHILEQWNSQLGAFRLTVTSKVVMSEAFKVDFLYKDKKTHLSTRQSKAHYVQLLFDAA